MLKKIILEKPVSWMKNSFLGSFVSEYYSNILKAAFALTQDVQEIDVFFHTKTDKALEFYHRNPTFDSDTLYISYHTYGDNIKNLYRIKENYIPGFFSIDSCGYSGFSLISDQQKRFLEAEDNSVCETYCKNLSSDLLKSNLSKYPQPKIQENLFTGDYVFFPLQIKNDTVMSLSYFDYNDLIESVTSNITNYPLIIKQHPRDSDIKLKKRLVQISQKRRNILISSSSIHTLIQHSRCCLTINSGVGFEAIVHNKPCVTFGKSDYAICTTVCNNIKEINNNLIFQAINNHNTNLNYNFIYNYLSRYCIYSKNYEQIYSKLYNLFYKDSQ